MALEESITDRPVAHVGSQGVSAAVTAASLFFLNCSPIHLLSGNTGVRGSSSTRWTSSPI